MALVAQLAGERLRRGLGRALRLEVFRGALGLRDLGAVEPLVLLLAREPSLLLRALGQMRRGALDGNARRIVGCGIA
jgi:hypothetical protein